ncbi:MAG: response regulator transcription factor [Chloroflexi bacterium]|nr:response regulator transcription factor [Chloroflexota bacterium]
MAVIATHPDMKVAGEATNGREAIDAAKKLRPNIVLMDLSMPEMNGVEATRGILTEVPETNILMLTISEEEEDLFNAIKAGAKGYLLKVANPDELLRAIAQVAEGGVVISAAMAPKLLAEIGTGTKKQPEGDTTALSPRETEILELVAQGLTDKEIAEKLFISLNTAKTHLKSILAKLHLKSRSQVAAYQAKTQPAPQDTKTD